MLIKDNNNKKNRYKNKCNLNSTSYEKQNFTSIEKRAFAPDALFAFYGNEFDRDGTNCNCNHR